MIVVGAECGKKIVLPGWKIVHFKGFALWLGGFNEKCALEAAEFSSLRPEKVLKKADPNSLFHPLYF